ncbi:MAG: response regulator transcription factor [Microcystis panniformis Mp_MB_F_20051200_S9]|uniref:Response regulator transcription factor n=1 Tax=Microcystis panniformis Mp_MB_F_20051200_S9 TaxID=2486223 RepID=A0A552Q8T1_9CHRO|nr:MAG: response regulator transcription factor [Microcystis panniformis Mp_MB_F_20080800_S26D]TRV53910.1 MAG: response regulator transcription factor [Microcystis panniformis Mp_GB_SS_20050300_S99D]TRV54292.1 MAG: response regulator transcription factor [Microcystis panniformis Mp_GB_SS_20050300_S99]TRV56262.1 MAG: response regulator transcription factor [Microcystis panniformis Mp_MB_F_20080800_S26]TRV65628.1 MAG: response regulator transcription factor [Microcystis panniformis Mp_MB_F_200512
MSTPVLSSSILLVGIEENIAKLASANLQEAGYRPLIVPSIDSAFPEVESWQPAMIILDRLLAAEAGVKFCRRLRSQGSRVYIILLVSQETLEERLACLEARADDYFLKPYNSQSFLKLIRFYLQPMETIPEQLRFGDLVLDLATRRLSYKNKNIELTMKEFELLRYLMIHPKEVLSRDQILENVWGDEFQGESNVIEVYIRYLRLKMEAGGQKRLIHTVRGVGYVLRES